MAIQLEVAFVDVYAERGVNRLYAEAKGRTSDPGLDVDTAYGQLLRRMSDIGPNVRYAIVVPAGTEGVALRVPRPVRELLHVDVYTVDDEGAVRLAGP